MQPPTPPTDRLLRRAGLLGTRRWEETKMQYWRRSSRRLTTSLGSMVAMSVGAQRRVFGCLYAAGMVGLICARIRYVSERMCMQHWKQTRAGALVDV
jgi:hypothetical protein